MKYFLILWVCSALQGTCLSPPITKPTPFNSHYECVNAGYIDGMKLVQAMGRENVEEKRLFIAFNCKPTSSI
jgi:hypothetical protein